MKVKANVFTYVMLLSALCIQGQAAPQVDYSQNPEYYDEYMLRKF